MPRRSPSLTILACSLLLLTPALAQQQTATPTIRTSTRIVYIDVVVRDRSGHIVRNLDKSSFSLTEDGKPQRIDLFEPHTGSVPKPAPTRGPNGLVSNLPANSRDLSLNLVLFDLLDTDPTDQAFARERMISFLRALPPGKQVALFVLSNQLHMVQGVTSDSDTLVRAAQSIDLKQLNRTRSPTQQNRDLDTEAYADSQATIARVGGALESSLRGEDFQNLKARLNATGDAFIELARAVNGYPGRKNLFWLAGSFPSSTTNSLQAISTGQLTSIGGPGIGPSADPLTGAPTRGGAGSRLSLTNGGNVGAGTAPLSERADRAVADSEIAVYPISVVGVETDSIGVDQIGVGTAGSHTADTQAQTFHDRQDSRETMNNIARETGGEAFYGNNDVSRLLEHGFEDSENYYTLAFQPSNHDWNGKYRKLNVSLADRGYNLSYRRGYFGLPEQPPTNVAHQFQTAMRLDTPPSTMLSLRSAPSLAAPTAATGAPPAAQTNTTLDIAGVGFTTAPDGQRHARLQVGLMAYPLDREREPIQTSGTLNLNLTPEQYADLLQNGVSIKQQLPLKTGRYVLRVGVLDTGSGRIGTLTLPIQMP